MITVLIADDINPICKRCQKYIEEDSEAKVVAIANSGEDAVRQALALKPDIILMDIEMETRTAGLDATEEILARLPDTKIIILTVYEDDETVFNAFRLGVSDYLLKNSSPQEIITCIKDAYNECSPIRPVIAQKIRREFKRVKNSEKSFVYCLHLVSELTQTEIDILDLLSQGYTRSEICRLRCIELSTVKSHIKNILRKFNKTSSSEVIQLMNDLGIFDYIRNINKNFPLEKN